MVYANVEEYEADRARWADYLANVPTSDLQRALERREGVKTYRLLPEEATAFVVSGNHYAVAEGPCVITVNID